MQRCVRCIMDDSSDPIIHFDENGVCNYCKEAEALLKRDYHPNAAGREHMARIAESMRQDGKGKPYDCVMGISGGLDSSYVAYIASKLGLRILAVHADDGFDTEISRTNIEKLVRATNLTMTTITPDPVQYYGLIRAYLRAGVSNLDAPQDNVLFSAIYQFMMENNLHYFLSGGNLALESILQRGNIIDCFDLTNLKDIHRKFGDTPIDKLPLISFQQNRRYQRRLGLRTVRLLNELDYNRDRAFEELKEFCGFTYYGRKHMENALTAFIQGYWFPKKFGVDKRTSHLSSMIVSGQMTREDALRELEKPLYDETEMNGYMALIREKLELSEQEFQTILDAPTRRHEEFATSFYEHRFWPVYCRVKKAVKSLIKR